MHLTESDSPLIWERTGGGIPRVRDMLACLSVGRSPAEAAAQLAIYDDQQAANMNIVYTMLSAWGVHLAGRLPSANWPRLQVAWETTIAPSN